jgi:hypothetical protein
MEGENDVRTHALLPVFRRFNNLDYEIVNAELHIHCDEDFDDDSSTILGSSYNDPIVIPREKIESLPHNMVHVCISNIAETDTKIGGQTPDIIWNRNIIEITTRQTSSSKVLEGAITEKVNKYGWMVDQGIIDNLIVIVVSLDDVMVNHTLRFTPEEEIRIINAYRFGLRMQKAYVNECGRIRESKAEETMNYFKKYFKGFIKPPVKCKTKPMVRDFKPMSFVDWIMEHPAAGDNDDRTICHVPMFVSQTGYVGEPPLLFNFQVSHITSMWNQINHNRVSPGEDYNYLTLDTTGSINPRSGQAVYGKEKDNEIQNRFVFKLTQSDYYQLAKKGVWAKSNREYKKAVETGEIRKKGILSLNAPTFDIDQFLELEDLDSFSSDIFNWIPEGVHEEIDRCRSMEIMHCAANLDLIARECGLNLRCNTRGREMIVRKLPDRDVWLLLKPTKYSTSDDYPIFCSVLFRGTPYHGHLKMFEKCHMVHEDNWYVTDFFSLDAPRIEHLLGLQEQLTAHCICSLEDTGNLMTKKELKLLALILIEDKAETSKFLQQLRFYYMKLYSGLPNARRSAECIASKWDHTIRSRLHLFLYKRLIKIHKVLPDVPKIKSTNIDKLLEQAGYTSSTKEDENDYDELGIKIEISESLDVKNKKQSEEDENSMMDLPYTEISMDEMDEVMTPFGFTIKDSKTFMRASYYCMLYNKDRRNTGHDAKSILSKLLKREYQWSDRSDYRKIQAANGHPDFDVFTFDEGAISHYAERVMNDLADYREETTDQFKEEVCSKLYFKTLMSDLMSTKASSMAYKEMEEKGDESWNYADRDVRKKVCEALYEIREAFTSENLLENMHVVRKNIKKIYVSIFKKNQIGGARDIYILDIWCRLLVRCLEDIARIICEMHPSEMLTNSYGKERFYKVHMRKVRKAMKEGNHNYFKTVKFSSDMTNWANLFRMRQFELVYEKMLPVELHGFVKDVLDLISEKEIRLPDSFLNNVYNLETNLVGINNRLKKELREGGSKNCKKDGRTFKNETNMMQGILHYTSSLFHLCHLTAFKDAIEKLKLEADVVVSFECSSDDEGILITYIGEKNSVLRSVAKFLRVAVKLKNYVDDLFGVRTSWEKSTLSVSEIFEFNSKFLFGNTLAEPLIKFVSRSIDDNVQATLHNRIANFHSILRTLREHGGSGILCHCVSYLQRSNYMRNLGKGTMTWWDEKLENWLIKYKVSHLGYYRIPSPFVAGLVPLDYMNYLSCCESEDARRMQTVLGPSSLVDFDEYTNFALAYDLGSNKKYRAMLRRLNIPVEKEMTELDFELQFRREENLEESKLKMKGFLKNPTIAYSFAQSGRIRALFMSAYIMWAKVFRGERFENLIRKIELSDEVASMDVLHPYHRFYESIKYFDNNPKVKTRKRRRLRQVIGIYNPIMQSKPHRTEIRSVLMRCVFNKPELTRVSRTQAELYLEDIKQELPWWDANLRIMLDQSPFLSYNALASFFTQYERISKPMRLLAVRHNAGNAVISLSKHNTDPFFTYVIGKTEDYSTERYNDDVTFAMLHFERLFSKLDLFVKHYDRGSDNTQPRSYYEKKLSLLIEEVLMEAFTRLGLDVGMIYDSLPGLTVKRANFWLFALASCGLITPGELYNNLTGDYTVYIQPQKKSNKGVWLGRGKILVCKRGRRALFDVQSHRITKITTPNREFDWDLEANRMGYSTIQDYKIDFGDIIIDHNVSKFHIKSGRIRCKTYNSRNRKHMSVSQALHAFGSSTSNCPWDIDFDSLSSETKRFFGVSLHCFKSFMIDDAERLEVDIVNEILKNDESGLMMALMSIVRGLSNASQFYQMSERFSSSVFYDSEEEDYGPKKLEGKDEKEERDVLAMIKEEEESGLGIDFDNFFDSIFSDDDEDTENEDWEDMDGEEELDEGIFSFSSVFEELTSGFDIAEIMSEDVIVEPEPADRITITSVWALDLFVKVHSTTRYLSDNTSFLPLIEVLGIPVVQKRANSDKMKDLHALLGI